MVLRRLELLQEAVVLDHLHHSLQQIHVRVRVAEREHENDLYGQLLAVLFD